ncbi:DNA polymerase [Schaalia radingae]|uniref:DNA-directed DNA polymerase n=1 Tax=Schaalia radingae TaxID=131110 RepID=A0ABY0V542_9ACTO|nr:DNA polymerase [Schaalia radingae]SDT85799.1 DNA polymerase [Schaalia radingae]
MKHLAIDIETFSATSIDNGVYAYAADPSFQILLFAYKTDDEATRIIDLVSGETLPSVIVDALINPNVTKHAFNASFERVCLSHHLQNTGLIRGFLDPVGWHCTMVHALYAGLPGSLKQAGEALHLSEQKLTEGRALIRKFCTPGRNGQRTLPSSDPAGWAKFKTYCKRDVDAETAIREHLKNTPIPKAEWENYYIDQYINTRGVGIDTGFARAAQKIGADHEKTCLQKARELTHVENPKSVPQLLDWVNRQGYKMNSLSKQTVSEALADPTLPSMVREALLLRQEISRSSTKKYDTMLGCTVDGRAHGLLQFYGAGRTGRWAGRLIQVQNLPRNHMSDLDAARRVISTGDAELASMLYESVPDTLSQLIRTALIPSADSEFIVCDYSAIEARVIAWLAGQEDTLQAFREGKDLYCETASRMFGVPVEKHGVNGELRQKGKIATLACGYGGSVGALEAMGALHMGLAESELKPIVDAWRTANPRIVRMWWHIGEAAMRAVTTRKPSNLYRLHVSMHGSTLTITLPSGRALYYRDAQVSENRWGNLSVNHMGLTPNRRWARVTTYGPKLVENIVQAVARDILAHAIRNLNHAGYPVVMHVHDEVVVESMSALRDVFPNGFPSEIRHVQEIMCRAPEWAGGLPLAAEGYTCHTYRKD